MQSFIGLALLVPEIIRGVPKDPLEVSFFTRRGGLLKIGGGDQVLFLRSKGGIKRFFK